MVGLQENKRVSADITNTLVLVGAEGFEPPTLCL